MNAELFFHVKCARLLLNDFMKFNSKAICCDRRKILVNCRLTPTHFNFKYFSSCSKANKLDLFERGRLQLIKSLQQERLSRYLSLSTCHHRHHYSQSHAVDLDLVFSKDSSSKFTFRQERKNYSICNINKTKLLQYTKQELFLRMSATAKLDFTSSSNSHSKEQIYDFFLVLDFEATCDDKAQPNPQEIIEFPVLKVNAKTKKIDSVFHKYVLPQYHPQLTPFCTELTGIIQSMVDNQQHLPETLQSFHQWMESEGLLDPDIKSIFVICGDWDLKSMLPKQCAVLDLAARQYFKQWINIKKSYAEMTGTFPKGMMVMLRDLNIKHVGRHHSGIDDCQNIANVLIAMMQKGFVFKQNGSAGRL
ncbi:unnamed protein product [Lymnaea stagnalis]|uniref:Exonuclease domain-containing protein n=1 Tax=Lymnaea stagnalis TaxID=6523 RepID=A0AAV2HQP4_LYMST